MIDRKSQISLELNKILLAVSAFCYGETTKQNALEISCESELKNAEQLMEYTALADKVLYVHLANPMTNFEPCDELLKKASIASVLDAGEILKVARLLRSFRIAKTAINEVEDETILPLRQITESICIYKKLEDNIFNCILSDTEIADSASSLLRQIRRNIENCNTEIREKLSDMVRNPNTRKYLQDNLITMRNGRYVIPVRTDSRQHIPGLVHDMSTSKLTVFVEPMAILELNNKLKTLHSEEGEEIERILFDFTSQIKGVAQDIQVSFFNLEQLDLIFAKAAYSRSIKGIRPALNNSGIIHLLQARHPLIDKDKVVPISIDIGKSFDVLVITGPNTGGKTVSIKTVGLLSLMAMLGIFLPCNEGSEISVFDKIFCDIGDKQSIEESLSTFSSHIVNIKEICENVANKSLILLDEIGGGTDPEEGAALAVSIIDYLQKKGGKLITTTHYGQVKEYCKMHKRAENASMEFDPDTLLPTFKLNIGYSGSSKALEIATNLGLCSEVIEGAKNNLSPLKKQENAILTEANAIISHNTKLNAELKEKQTLISRQLSEVQAEKKRLEEKLDKISQSANSKAKELLGERMAEVDEMLSHIKKMTQKTDFTTSDIVKGGELRNKILAMADTFDKPIKNGVIDRKPFVSDSANIGDAVFVQSLNQSGKITRLNDKKQEAVINFGLISLDVKYRDLFFEEMEKTARNANILSSHTSVMRSAKSEINLLGQSVYDAEINVESFLDDALLAGLKEVKIIHGRGTGKLRDAISRLLKHNGDVSGFRRGNFGEGDSGVTIVTLK